MANFSAAAGRPALLGFTEVGRICFSANRVKISIGCVPNVRNRQTAGTVNQETRQMRSRTADASVEMSIGTLLHGDVVARRPEMACCCSE